MEVIRNERAPATGMRMDNHRKSKTYNRVHPREPNRERVYKRAAEAEHPYKRYDARRRKVRVGNKQSGGHTLKTRVGPTSTNHLRQEPSRGLEHPPGTLPIHKSDEHITDNL